ncbi:MAG: haloacid dehalogenase-like hydrolase [Ignavibacteriae bacterium]|nr:haloacid dehalogenase-like hydrolase [Ignavibacteriota bacterium]
MKNTIALVFDFDETLAADSTTAYLKSLGIDVQNFWRNKVDALLDEGWDPIPAYLFQMIQESQSGTPITRQSLQAFGKKVGFYKGVPNLFSNLRKHIARHTDTQLEFYIISSGIGDIIRQTKIAKHFSDIWSSDFAYDCDGRILFPRRVISFTDKTRYLFSISKGLIGEEYRNKPFEVNEKVERKDGFRIPFTQMIFVGDGMTDVPCFALMKKMNGLPIAVYDPKNPSKWERAWRFLQQERVKNLVPADYSSHSALTSSLKMAIDSIVQRIELSKKMYPG